MLPTLVNASRVLVDKARTTPAPNSLFVIADNGYLLVKRFQRSDAGGWWCSDNPAYERIAHAESIEVVALVRWGMRRFDDAGN